MAAFSGPQRAMREARGRRVQKGQRSPPPPNHFMSLPPHQPHHAKTGPHPWLGVEVAAERPPVDQHSQPDEEPAVPPGGAKVARPAGAATPPRSWASCSRVKCAWNHRNACTPCRSDSPPRYGPLNRSCSSSRAAPPGPEPRRRPGVAWRQEGGDTAAGGCKTAPDAHCEPIAAPWCATVRPHRRRSGLPPPDG
jgi:hypothetical protein